VNSEVPLVLTNCRLIDGTGGEPVPDATIIVSDGRITAIGPATSISIPQGAEIIDLQGLTVLPGFFNAHVHNGFNLRNLEQWAQGGVTTVRDLAGPSNFVWKDGLSANPDYARLIAAGPMVSVPNGYPYNPWGSPYMLPVVSPEDARNKVAALIEDGADIVKLAMESGENFGRIIPMLTPEEALAAVEVAHEYGTVASAHVLMAGDLGKALQAGVDDIAHMVVDFLPDSLIEEMVQNSVIWVPTIELWHHVGHGYKDIAINNLRKFVEAGGIVALGTDYDGYSATFQMGIPTDEMVWMAEAGMSNSQIIVAGTRNAAKVCDRSSDLGTLEAGKLADLVVVDGDPLSNIRVLEDLYMVVHNGTIIRSPDL